MELVSSVYLPKVTAFLTFLVKVTLVYGQNTVSITTSDLSPSIGKTNYDLECTIINFEPAPNRALAWTKNGKLITWDDTVQFIDDQIAIREYDFQSTTYYTITIREVAATHCGVYKCLVADGESSSYTEVASSADAEFLPEGIQTCLQPTTTQMHSREAHNDGSVVRNTKSPQHRDPQTSTAVTNNIESNVTIASIRPNGINFIIIYIAAGVGGLVLTFIIVIVACICLHRIKTKAIDITDNNEHDVRNYDSDDSWDSIDDGAVTRESRAIYRNSDSEDPVTIQRPSEEVRTYTNAQPSHVVNITDSPSSIKESTMSPSLVYSLKYLNAADDYMNEDDLVTVADSKDCRHVPSGLTDERFLYSHGTTDFNGRPNFDQSPPGTQGYGNPDDELRLYDLVPPEN